KMERPELPKSGFQSLRLFPAQTLGKQLPACLSLAGLAAAVEFQPACRASGFEGNLARTKGGVEIPFGTGARAVKESGRSRGGEGSKILLDGFSTRCLD